MIKKIIYCILIVFSTCKLYAQDREFRAAWVATVANIDWPSSSNLSSYQQKQEFTAILDKLENNNFNAVVVQIRPSMDALYPSSYEPWSRYFSKSGTPPSPYYDPLQFMIDECHKRCMELHAWINPFRAYSGSRNPHPNNHVTYTHPEWFYTYGETRLMNAGVPEAQDYLVSVINDILKRYDIDALHMDDYFYPYTIAGKSIPDQKEYAQYNTSHLSIGDWRRNNIDKLIYRIKQTILHTRPSVQFGISPFGVWRNQKDDPKGSYTNAGQTNYDNLYADVRKWMQNGWIDYCAPQLYWERGHRAADYNQLVRWWPQHSYGTYLYVGLQIYMMHTSKNPVWHSTRETLEQLQLAQSSGYNGFILYSVKYLMSNTRNIYTDLAINNLREPAIPPSHKHAPAEVIPTPQCTVAKAGNNRAITVNNPDPKCYYVVGIENLETKFELLSKSKNGTFNITTFPYNKYFVCAVSENQNVSEKCYF